MKRRGFFGALLALPTLLCITKSDSGWRRAAVAPVDELVWVVYAGGHCVGLGKKCQDGVWEHPDRLVIHSATHWMRILYPQSPIRVKEKKYVRAFRLKGVKHVRGS